MLNGANRKENARNGFEWSELQTNEWRMMMSGWLGRRCFLSNLRMDEPNQTTIAKCNYYYFRVCAWISPIQHHTIVRIVQFHLAICDLLVRTLISYRKIISILIVRHQSSKWRCSVFMSQCVESGRAILHSIHMVRIHYAGFVLFSLFLSMTEMKNAKKMKKNTEKGMATIF